MASSISTYNTQWRGLAELLILREGNARACTRDKRQKVYSHVFFVSVQFITNQPRQGERVGAKVVFMVKEELRRVTFSLNFPQGFYPDEKEQAEVDELAHVRNGLFYGKTEVMDGELKIVMFVVEDEETGKIHYVDPRLVTFIK